MPEVICPCCHGGTGVLGNHGETVCATCGHRWREALQPTHYFPITGRNNVCPEGLNRKLADRLATLRPLLHPGMTIAEIGCAEGALGRRIKETLALQYVGVEISADAEIARQGLDVVLGSVENLPERSQDLILAFHMLEHLDAPAAALLRWRRLLKTSGRLVVEVPNRAGHPLLDWDGNAEHAHQFTAASLTVLAQRAGFDCHSLSTGHFESAVYPDCLRLVATITPSPEEKQAALLARFNSRLGMAFVIHGIGGDFLTYVAPFLSGLGVKALCDNNPEKQGKLIAGHLVCPFDPVAFAGLPVLIASTRHGPEIVRELMQRGIPATHLVTLDDIYNASK